MSEATSASLKWRSILLIAVGLVAAILFIATSAEDNFWPHLISKPIPVLAYIIVICTMLWRAACRVGAPGIYQRSAWVGLTGAAFFTLSDTLLASGMFAGQRPLGPHAVIITYWIGQLGITLSAYWQMVGRPAVSGQPSVVS